MTTPERLTQIYNDLGSRYDRISVSTIKGLLRGKMKVRNVSAEFEHDKHSTPRIEEAEKAFLIHNCVILTAFRGGNTLSQNIERNERLKADMETEGLSYRPVMGCYREADWEYASIEYCFFIYNNEEHNAQVFFEKAYRLSEKYEQDSFLYKRAGINRTAFLIATNDAGRAEFRDDIKFAGQLFLRVPDVDAWTDCKDGRIAFQLKGMILIDTKDKKIKIGEGNLFDVEGYDPDGIVVLRRDSQQDLTDSCRSYDGSAPLIQHRFVNDEQTETTLRRAVMAALNKAREKKCRKIGFHCSAQIEGSAIKAAAIAFAAVKDWVKLNKSKIDQIIIVDIYGDYSKAMDD